MEEMEYVENINQLSCIICSVAVAVHKKVEKDKAPKVLFHQFCKTFLPVGSQQLGKGRSVCSDCARNVGKALGTRGKMEEVEDRVLELQQQVLDEMKELKMYVDLLAWQLGKIERCVKIKNKSDFNVNVGGNGAQKRRGRPPRKMANDDEHLVRECIANVTNGLHHFQHRLSQKVSEGHVEGNKLKKTTRHNEDNFNRSRTGFNRTSDRDDDDEDANYNYLLPAEATSPSSCSNFPPSPPHPPYDKNSDDESFNNEFGGDKNRTIVIKKIKLEPTSEPEDEEGIQHNLVEGEDDEHHSQDVCERSGKIRRRGKVVWNPIQLTEAELKRDFRIQKRIRNKYSHELIYYCAYGLKRHLCPVRVKVAERQMTGERAFYRNDEEHKDHRTRAFGLTSEQKDFTNDCISKGVAKPVDIVYSFRAAGLEPPETRKISSYLERYRRDEKEREKALLELADGEQAEEDREMGGDGEGNPSQPDATCQSGPDPGSGPNVEEGAGAVAGGVHLAFTM